MKRKWWLVPIILAALFGLLWMFASGTVDTTPIQTALGLKPAAAPVAKEKPICSQVIVPAGDCIPQHLAHLPPDPGPAGMKTLEGIDADRDGVRDDVQRFIFIEYGHSQRAVAALTGLAKSSLMQVKVGDSVTPDEAYAMVKDNHIATCYSRSVDEEIRMNALKRIEQEITNTPERKARFWQFQKQVANQNQGFMMPDFEEPLEKLCGYDPAALPN
jgi:hypothetical protein